jgi:hypothetical protein
MQRERPVISLARSAVSGHTATFNGVALNGREERPRLPFSGIAKSAGSNCLLACCDRSEIKTIADTPPMLT